MRKVKLYLTFNRDRVFNYIYDLKNAKDLYFELQNNILEIDTMVEENQKLKEDSSTVVDVINNETTALDATEDELLDQEEKEDLTIADRPLLEKQLFNNLFFKYVSLRRSIKYIRPFGKSFKKADIFHDFFF